MGKNQTHKSMQMAKHASRGGGGAAGEEPDSRYAGVDASFHTAEWHAARLAALQMERPSWDDWKKQQDEAAAREAAMEAAVAQAESEYKAALEQERARRLGYVKDGGVKKKEGKEKKEKKERSKKRKRSSKDKKKKHKRSSKDKRSKKKKRRHSSDSDSSSSGSSSDSGSSSSSLSGKDYGGMGSPVRLSKYLYA
ncbi:hypothetical protein ABPG77_009429 [Micractinium sp. CCAP 211/92]